MSSKYSSGKPETKTFLSSDTNLVETGTPIEVHLTGIEKQEAEGGMPVTASARGRKSGNVDVNIKQEQDDSPYIVRFIPSSPDEYTLEVKHHDDHVPGSPFTLKVVEKGTLAEDDIGGSVEAGQPLNFIIPIGDAKEPFVSVNSPFGDCDISVNDTISGIIALDFVPNVVGEYIVHVKVDDAHIVGSPYKINAKGNEPDASKCYILEEDMQVFKKHMRFGKGSAKFRVSTADAGRGSLDVISRGPGTAEVKIQDNKDGTETCEFTPSVAGKYSLDILWGDLQIKGSPYTINFRPPKTRFVSNGLNLQKEIYRVGVAHRFKLNCEDLGEGNLELTCKPETAANVSVSPANTPNSFVCEILPEEVGYHEISLKYKGKHIFGSPFNVHFHSNASKCSIIDTSDEHEVGGSVTFHVSTEGAGEGKVVASVENIATKETIPVSVTQMMMGVHRIEFNPGKGMECLLTVLYDEEHIRGSPYRLVFSEPSNCRAEGEGLLSAQCDQWNKFSVNTENAGPGILKVTIDREGESVDPSISAIDTTVFEVSYRPTKPGSYKITVKWGKFDIPGSPFEAYCYDITQFKVKESASEVHLGNPIEFGIEGITGGALGELVVDAKSTRGADIQGQVKKNDSGEFVCTLEPDTAGKYTVNARWNGVHVQGSPFKVRVITPPIPEKVRAHGPGLINGTLGQEGSFTVETEDAGTGLLAVRVHGPKGAFKIHTSRHADNDRSILVRYNPTHPGNYTIEITWATVHIPGSPFNVKINKPPEDTIAEEEEEEEEETKQEETNEGVEEGVGNGLEGVESKEEGVGNGLEGVESKEEGVGNGLEGAEEEEGEEGQEKKDE